MSNSLLKIEKKKLRFTYSPLYTTVEPDLPQEIVDEVLACRSYYITKFDDVRKRIVHYPIKKYIDWNFYDNGSFPSGFLGRVIAKLEENCFELVAEQDPPKPQYDFMRFFKSYLTRKDLKLRYFQEEAVDAVKAYGNGMIEIGTGGGKTLFYGNLIANLGLRTLVITIDLTSKQQTFKEMVEMFGILNVGMIDADDFHKYPIVVANIQNCWAKMKSKDVNYLRYINTVDLLIVNECHHINESELKNSLANTWYQVAMSIPAWYRIGATGTVGKEDSLQGFLFRAALGEIIYKKPTKELIQEGFATKIEVHVYDYYSTNQEYMSYVKAYQNLALDKDFNRMIAKLALYYADRGYKVAVFCEWLKNQMDVLEELLGDRCVAVSGKTKEDDRIKKFQQFAEGNPSILIGTVFNEDINIPAMDVGIILGKKKNERKVKQRTGRVARLFEGKKRGYIVLPYVKDRREAMIGDQRKLVPGLLDKHSKEAIRILKAEGHDIVNKNIEDVNKEITV